MLLILAPVRLIVLQNKPTGLAMLIGIPSDTSIGIRIMAAPTPPSEKINAAANEMMNINVSIVYSNYSTSQNYN